MTRFKIENLKQTQVCFFVDKILGKKIIYSYEREKILYKHRTL